MANGLGSRIKEVAAKHLDSQQIRPIDMLHELDALVIQLQLQLARQKQYAEDLNQECMQLVQDRERLRHEITLVESNWKEKCSKIAAQCHHFINKYQDVKRKLKKMEGLKI